MPTSPQSPPTANPNSDLETGLLDRAWITDLVSRLGSNLDSRNFEGLRDLFTPDATVTTPGGTAHGHDALVDQARRRHSTDVGIQHIITNVLIEHSDDDRATARANLLVSFARTGAGDPSPFLLGEIYDFDLRRTPAGWRLTALTSTPVWTLNDPR
ncbi:nuclear transport factor 2 family protein [Solwaraspora sp. WMMD1047]|uniref:nuclear transport factor 2 family protein n=1 Tax=Solwaraspora sp. WMMD1047 TaxID=3016102 RepID=UPI002416EE8A|nr:nuclear transport factor 2 family protein [Solwaraspora sp. WMMD1047]MDG4833930.1 nuclear transport factor 2 family protein [Solwaraspora sp. WMMD1047]